MFVEWIKTETEPQPAPVFVKFPLYFKKTPRNKNTNMHI
jgi:hypothetical protein